MEIWSLLEPACTAGCIEGERVGGLNRVQFALLLDALDCGIGRNEFGLRSTIQIVVVYFFSLQGLPSSF